jgi:hypothetical protein
MLVLVDLVNSRRYDERARRLLLRLLMSCTKVPRTILMASRSSFLFERREVQFGHWREDVGVIFGDELIFFPFVGFVESGCRVFRLP